jgi:hypothetical protein
MVLNIWKHPITKKRSSSNACSTIVEKHKNKNARKKNLHLWLGFKVMDVLYASKGLDKVAHKSVTKLIKIGMSEK